MTRTDLLTNRTMFPIGRIALDIEHLLVWKLYYRLKELPRPPSIHGCINDCLYLRATPPWAGGRRNATRQEEEEEMIESEIIQARAEADEANDKMAQQVECLLAEHPWMSWADDGSPIFRVEKCVTDDWRDVVTLWDAPTTQHRWKFPYPTLSKRTASN